MVQRLKVVSANDGASANNEASANDVVYRSFIMWMSWGI